MTLQKLLNHLKLVASYQELNKMTCQNLAVCFGPVLLSQRQEASCHTNRVFIDSEELASALHFKKHIEVLHYLLQLWPGDYVVLDSFKRALAATPPWNNIYSYGLVWCTPDFFLRVLKKSAPALWFELYKSLGCFDP